MHFPGISFNDLFSLGITVVTVSQSQDIYYTILQGNHTDVQPDSVCWLDIVNKPRCCLHQSDWVSCVHLGSSLPLQLNTLIHWSNIFMFSSKLAAFQKKAHHCFERSINQEQNSFQLDCSCSRPVVHMALIHVCVCACVCVCVCVRLCVSVCVCVCVCACVWFKEVCCVSGPLGKSRLGCKSCRVYWFTRGHKLDGNYRKQLDSRFPQSCSFWGCSLKGLFPSYLPKRNYSIPHPRSLSRQTSIDLSGLETKTELNSGYKKSCVRPWLVAIGFVTLMIYSYGIRHAHTQHDLHWLTSVMSHFNPENC